MKQALLAVTTCMMSLLLTGSVTAATDYPTKPVRLVVPWPPGPTDSVARVVSAQLAERLKQSVIVDNRAGAGGIIGMQNVAQSPPDGYHLMMTSTAYGYLIARPKVNVDLIKSFVPIALLGISEAAFVVHPSVPVNSVKELIALAKARPGSLHYASSGVGGFPHMNTELFKLMTGIDLLHVPFKGGGPAITNVVAGHTQLILTSLPGLLPHIKAGRLKVLGVGSLKRSPSLPDVPTISEAGVPGYETTIWYGLFAPAATPSSIVQRLHSEANAVLAEPELRKRYEALGVLVRTMSSAEFAKFMRSEAEKWMRVVEEAGIKAGS